MIVVREGGSLVMREIEYYIVPNGEVEFYGSTNVLVFEPGVISKNATIVARGDGVPEVLMRIKTAVNFVLKRIYPNIFLVIFISVVLFPS